MDPFTLTIQKLYNLGFFKFLLPFMLTSAVFYGLLRKSQIFGPPEKNIAVNAIVALTAAFMVWSYPVIAGVDVQQYFVQFFMQATIISVVIIFGLLLCSMVLPPDLPAQLKEKLGGRSYGIILMAFLILGFVVLLSSGLLNVFFPSTALETGGISSDVLITVGVVIALVIAVIAIVGIGGK